MELLKKTPPPDFIYEAEKHIKLSCTGYDLKVPKETLPVPGDDPGYYLHAMFTTMVMMQAKMKELMAGKDAPKKVMGYTELMDDGLNQQEANRKLLQQLNIGCQGLQVVMREFIDRSRVLYSEKAPPPSDKIASSSAASPPPPAAATPPDRA